MTLFNANESGTPPQTPVETPTEGNYIDLLVGEGKKYKDHEALAKAMVHAQNHIQQLETENANAREEIAKRATMEEFLDRIESRSRAPEAPNHGTQNGNENQETRNQLTPEAIKELVKQATLEERTQATQEQNLRATVEELRKAWGNEWQSKLNAKRLELGLTEDFMNSIAFKSPKALLNLVGAKAAAPEAPDNLPRGHVVAPSSVKEQDKRNKAYWDKMAKTDPMLWKSAAMTAERHRIAQQMGSKFFE